MKRLLSRSVSRGSSGRNAARWMLLSCVYAAVLSLGPVGCSTWPANMSHAGRTDELTKGYGALRQLLDDERSVDKILIVKSVSDATKELIEEIASESSSANDQLRELSMMPPAVRLDEPGSLPLIEQTTRDSIRWETTLDLLFSDDTFEVRLLMSQGQALRYGRFLAEELASRETVQARREWLEELARKCEEQYARVIGRMAVAR